MSQKSNKQNMGSEPLHYNLFGKPNSTVAMNSQPNADNGATEGSAVNVNSPAIQNVGGYGNAVGTPVSKEQMVNTMQAKVQPIDYGQKLAEQNELAKKQYQSGENVSGWINRNFASPKTGNGGQSKEGNRRTIQSIAAISDVLRHAANLYYTSKGATPQNIQSQVAMNQAKWQAEDALEAERAKAQQEMEIKIAKQRADEAYKAGQLGLGAERNAIAKGNYELAVERAGREADMHELNKTAKQAGIDKTKHDSELADKKFEADQKQRGIQNGLAQQRLALGWANHNLSAMRAARSNSGGGGRYGGRSVGKKGDGSAVFTTPSGVRYTLSKEYQNNISQVYDAMVKKNIIPPIIKTDSAGKDYQARPSKADMINAVMKAADSRQGHDDFVWWGKRLGYEYVDGMTHDISNRVGGGMGYQGASI